MNTEVVFRPLGPGVWAQIPVISLLLGPRDLKMRCHGEPSARLAPWPQGVHGVVGGYLGPNNSGEVKRVKCDQAWGLYG